MSCSGYERRGKRRSPAGISRQRLDEKCLTCVTLLAQELQFLLGTAVLEGANLFDGAHGLERAGDHLGRARTADVVASLCLEQFGVREDDPELVIKAVKEETEVWRFVHRIPGAQLLDGRRP